jgi:hypothetical protein
MPNTYNEAIQQMVRRYQAAGQPWPTTAREIAEWAIRTKHWAPHPSTIVSQCADQIARALREEYITDPQGRRIRAKHVARVPRGGEQMSMWDDIRHAPPNFMATALQQRRQQILGDCQQLKADADSYNDNWNSGAPVQLVFDFTADLEELESVESLYADGATVAP